MSDHFTRERSTEYGPLSCTVVYASTLYGTLVTLTLAQGSGNTLTPMTFTNADTPSRVNCPCSGTVSEVSHGQNCALYPVSGNLGREPGVGDKDSNSKRQLTLSYAITYNNEALSPVTNPFVSKITVGCIFQGVDLRTIYSGLFVLLFFLALTFHL